ncbi:hypothetical protein [Owenweeksia hongkongensis]|uniref:hypothetical protein n=1 Tax=Owenweeksia hongkongensis TaxID=253245 RepID=UPI003A8DC058
MDKAQQFRIDAYEKTGKQKLEPVRSSAQPMPFQSYQLAREGDIPLAIDFRKLDGHRFGMAYSQMQKLEYDPDPVNEAVVIQFSGGEVRIKGVNLEFIYEGLLSRRLVWVKEVNGQLLERYREVNHTEHKKAQIPLITRVFSLNC